MKIIKRRPIVWHTLTFLIFSIFYLYIEKSLAENTTAIDGKSFLSYLHDHKLLIIASLVSAIFIFNLKKISKQIMLLLIGYMGYLMTMIIYYDFNKLIFIMILLYLLIGGYFYYFWSVEIGKPLYNPIFSTNDLDIRPMIPISIIIRSKDSNQLFHGQLCNWDEDSCFVILNQTADSDLITKVKVKDKVKAKVKNHQKVVVDFNCFDRVFTNDGEICAVSNELNGLGIELKIGLDKINNPQFNFDFALLYSTLSKMGFVPKEYHC
ncbi:MAG: hypothetical protein HQK49_08285 [Oligoflexia bacterium]|nr:hypothetical protein [Oligoflexia bacterium]